MKSVVSLARLQALFGTKAHLEYPSLPYKENVVTIEADLPTHKVWLQFMPGCGYAHLRLVGKPFSFVRLDLFDIKHMRIQTEEGRSTLVFKFARGFTGGMTLCVQDPLMLCWGNYSA